jgi:hypothetical protein
MVKNRESAARSRLRRQQYTSELEAKVAELAQRNKALAEQLEAARQAAGGGGGGGTRHAPAQQQGLGRGKGLLFAQPAPSCHAAGSASGSAASTCSALRRAKSL